MSYADVRNLQQAEAQAKGSQQQHTAMARLGGPLEANKKRECILG